MKLQRIFKSAILSLMVIFFGAASSFAQQKMTPDQRIEKRVQNMKVQLNLTDEQVAKIRPILSDAQQKMMQLRSSGEDKEAMKTQRKAIASDLDRQIAALLNPDQLQKYGAMKERMKERRKQNNDGGQPGE